MSIPYETKAFVTRDATIGNTASTMLQIGFTAAQLSMAKRALVTVDAQALRMTYDGTVPTSTYGHLIPSTTNPFYMEGTQNIRNLQFIRSAGADGEVTITLETDLN